MKRALILAALLPSVAWGQTSAAQFVPPGGLPLETPVGPSRNTDGTAVVTLGSMQADIQQNSAGLAALAASSVTQSDLKTALGAYLPLMGGSLSGALGIGGDLTIGGKIYALGYAPVAPNDHSYFICADGYNGYLYPATQPCR